MNGWQIWLCVLLFILFILWILYGGKRYDFVGISPLSSKTDSTKYIDPLTKYIVGNIDEVEDIDYSDEVIPESFRFLDKRKDDEDRINEGEDDIEEDQHDVIEESNHEIQQEESVDVTPQIPAEVLKGSAKVPSPKRDIPIPIWKSRREKLCSEILQKIYNVPFYTCKPKFLKNPETGRLLEIDCYNKDLKLGLEVQGIHHYQWPNWTNQSYREWIQVIRKDQYKVEACDVNGVYLITVPYNVPDHLLERYIHYYSPEEVQKRLIRTEQF